MHSGNTVFLIDILPFYNYLREMPIVRDLEDHDLPLHVLITSILSESPETHEPAIYELAYNFCSYFPMLNTEELELFIDNLLSEIDGYIRFISGINDAGWFRFKRLHGDSLYELEFHRHY